MPVFETKGVLVVAFVLVLVLVCVAGARHPNADNKVTMITIAILIRRSYLIELERNVASGAEWSGARAVDATVEADLQVRLQRSSA